MPRLSMTTAAAEEYSIGRTVTYVTSGTSAGDTNPNTSGAFAQLAGVGEVAVTAAVGDYVECYAEFLVGPVSTAFFDLAVIKTSSLVWYASNGTGTPAAEGNTAMYPISGSSVQPISAAAGLTVTSTELDGTQVRFVLVIKAAGTGKTYYSSSYPFRWRAINYGAPA